MTLQIIDMPDDPAVQQLVASTCVNYWKRDFPLDTAQWYLDLYADSLSGDALPVVLVALQNGEFAGTASLIADDELPDAPEPGPWVAAVFVADEYRKQGIGTALVNELQRRASSSGITKIFLYTESGATWYEAMGWQRLRTAELSGHDVTVMSLDVQATV
ncbi:MAG: GNAT family N-acetyltransferase [Ilumatobacteraceae bacterium]